MGVGDGHGGIRGGGIAAAAVVVVEVSVVVFVVVLCSGGGGGGTWNPGVAIIFGHACMGGGIIALPGGGGMFTFGMDCPCCGFQSDGGTLLDIKGIGVGNGMGGAFRALGCDGCSKSRPEDERFFSPLPEELPLSLFGGGASPSSAINDMY